MASILDVQRALAAKGFDPGNLDGVWGRRTIAAVRAFQASRGLEVDGVVGPITSKALFGTTPKPKDPRDDLSLVWYHEAKRLMGLKEVAGAGSNPVILNWAKDLDIHYPDDDIAWCGLFVGHCIASTLTTEPLPGNPLGARNWAKFGGPCTPRPGAVLVFWRGARNGWQGHVGFYAGETDSAFAVIGGNQSNSVCMAWLGKDRLLDCRWPATVPLTQSGPVRLTQSGALSKNEA